MFYGTPCTLPGSILDVPEFDSQELLNAFAKIRDVTPLQAPPDTTPSTPIPNLCWVYMRVDSVKPPLHPKYQGPYKVLSQTRNTARL